MGDEWRKSMGRADHRVRPGPLERYAFTSDELYPNFATALLAQDVLRDFRESRTKRREEELPMLPIRAGGMRGRLELFLDRWPGTPRSGLLFEFDRLMVEGSQIRRMDGSVSRFRKVKADAGLPTTVALATVGQPLYRIIELPSSLARVLGARAITSAEASGFGTIFILENEIW